MRVCDRCKSRIDNGVDYSYKVEMVYKPEPIEGYQVKEQVTTEFELCAECSRKVRDILYEYIRLNKEG